MDFTSKKVIIFDLDGTLVDSVPDLASAINAMLADLKRPDFSEETIRHWVGNGAQTLVKRALSGDVKIDETISKNFFEKALALFLSHYHDHLAQKTRLYPGVVSTLEYLKQQDYRLTIVTNKPIVFVEPLLKGLQIEHYFEHCLGGDSLERKKPDPLPLTYLCETLNVTVDEAVMIGDSKNDILAANAANMESIGVTYGYNYGEPITHFGPTAVVDELTELKAYF